MAPRKAPKPIEINKDLLKKIVDETSKNGHTFCSVLEISELEKRGLVESNPDMQNEDGDTAVRATMQGFDLIYPDGSPEPEPTTQAVEEPAPAKTKGNTMFVIEDAIPVPAKTVKRGRAAGSSKYPFHQLEVGQSFMVPATDKLPDPAKSLASAVAAAIRVYATQNGTKTYKGREITAYTPTRMFEVRAVEGGARVWRTA